MTCPITDSLKDAVDYMKLAANRVLFAVVYVIAFCLSMAKSLLGLTMALADDFLHRVAKLLALPVGFSLAMIDLLRMGFAALKDCCSTGITASKGRIGELYQSAKVTTQDVSSTVGEKMQEVLEPSMKVKEEVVDKIASTFRSNTATPTGSPSTTGADEDPTAADERSADDEGTKDGTMADQ